MRLTAGILLKSLLVWLAILMLAIINGVLREIVLVPWLGSAAGLALSGVLLSVLIVVISYAVLPWLGVRQIRGLLSLGLIWLGLTLVFEFAFGLWQGKPWSVLLEAYTFKDGNLWSLVLLVTMLSPCIAARLRGWI